MKKVAPICLVFLLAGCSLLPVPETEPEPPRPEPKAASSAGVEVEPLRSAPPEACERIVELSEAGDHRQVLERFNGLVEDGIPCRDRMTEGAFLRSAAAVSESHFYLREAQQKGNEGDLAGARRSVERSLDAYPGYYTAQKLKRDVDSAIESEVSRLIAEARQLREAGAENDAQEALTSALELDPGNAEASLLLESSRVMATTLTVEELQTQVARLIEDGEHFEALGLLRDAESISPDDPVIQADTEALERRLAGRGLSLSRAAAEREDLDLAARQLVTALKTRPRDPDLRRELVEFARVLGLQLFSVGQLTRAGDVWRNALPLDPANPKLIDYLDQVDQRLGKLEQIRIEESDPPPAMHR